MSERRQSGRCFGGLARRRLISLSVGKVLAVGLESREGVPLARSGAWPRLRAYPINGGEPRALARAEPRTFSLG